MENNVATVKKEQTNGSSNVSQKCSDHHNKAAKHHQEAAKFHLEAAKFHDAGEKEKACESNVKARGHSSIAHDAEREAAKQHALIS
jgi:hypothetical protein